MRSMVEGGRDAFARTFRTPLHHFVVPLPVSGRIYSEYI
jgi:hypothetical protein